MRRGGERIRWGSFPTTADVGIFARAGSAAGLLEGLGHALFGQFTDLRRVRPTERRAVEASGADLPATTVAFLEALLLLEQDDGFIGRTIAVAVSDRGRHVRATVRGEPFDASRHRPGIEVKAVTYHRIEVDPVRGRARVILDI
ncbi:MAG TPA: archease [Thermoplasmata archaeon]|nr:archease [Thermoplasmata archaeon]HUJ78569.1 archease [Thermoplasmata archaeon]